VLAVEETSSEVIVTVETTADFVGCPTCGVRAEAKDRLRVDIRTCPVSDVLPAIFESPHSRSLKFPTLSR